ncbi:PREDICTED: protein MON2 homolog isoform X2 [Nicotiana attenuata]|uniref:protein MON2 homolog isoform X2 n=1 Tax=Nicotiana attenuata TaxID=49451 RepID=UPI00090498C7|nr:PREDICTED: protein MON2 homolog isoform X2 [Nicotiana attenuata]
MALMAVLESDLRALSAEARRRYPAVKDAAEHAILKLRCLSSPSEIVHNEDILKIFLMACEVRTVKMSVIGLSCLQKLISHDVVAPSALKEILDTLKDHGEMADESLQLKTLQTILIIFQSRLQPDNEDYTAQALGIILRLLENNRSSDSVRNTAAATFRQAVALIFDRVVSAESLPAGKFGSGVYISRSSSVSSDVNRNINQLESLEQEFSSGGPSLMRDNLTKSGKLALRLLEDLTALAAGGSAVWLRVSSIQRTFALDLLEFILSNYVVVFRALVPYEEVLRRQICSLLMTSLRTDTEPEGESGEPYFRRLVLRSVANIIRLYSSSLITESEVFLSMLVRVISLDLPLWHRILVLEILRGFCVEARTMQVLFLNFDMHPKNTNVVEGMVKALARVVSSIQFQDTCEESLAAVAGMFSSKAKGIEWSLDSDASNAAVLVASEAHAITLAIEGLLGVVFTVATLTDEAVDVGELDSPRCESDPPAKLTGRTALLCVSMVDSLWLTILDALSFILAKSQGEAIILEILKGYQAFTQACGILHAVEPLNSFLASLCKFTIGIPVEVEKRSVVQSPGSKRSEALLEPKETIVLTPKNVQALRTLFNISHRLHNVLGPSWSLVLETLASLDRAIHSPHATTQEVSTAVPKLTRDSSGQYSDFHILSSLNSQLFESSALMDVAAVKSLLSALRQLSHQCMSAAVSSFGPPSSQKSGSICFSVERMLSILVNNMHRVGPLWDEVICHFIELTDSSNQHVRTIALNAMDQSISAVLGSNQVQEHASSKLQGACNDVQTENIELRSLECAVISPLKVLYSSAQNIDVRAGSLKILLHVLERHGEKLHYSWPNILELLRSVANAAEKDLITLGFQNLRVIMNDGLSTVPADCLHVCIDVTGAYSAQNTELNISLTAIGLLWTSTDFIVKGFLYKQNEEKESDCNGMKEERALSFSGKVNDQALQMNIVDCDKLLFSIFSLLQNLGADERPEVRNSAVRTLFQILGSHGQKLSKSMWEDCLWNYVLPTLDRSSHMAATSSKTEWQGKELGTRGGKAIHMLIHHSRNTAQKQWDETLVLVLGGIARILRSFFPFLRSLENFQSGWQTLLLCVRNSIFNGSKEVALAAVNCLQSTIVSHSPKGNLPMPYLTSVLDVYELVLHKSPNYNGNMAYKLKQEILYGLGELYVQAQGMFDNGTYLKLLSVVDSGIKQAKVANSNSEAEYGHVPPLQRTALEILPQLRPAEHLSAMWSPLLAKLLLYLPSSDSCMDKIEDENDQETRINDDAEVSNGIASESQRVEASPKSPESTAVPSISNHLFAEKLVPVLVDLLLQAPPAEKYKILPDIIQSLGRCMITRRDNPDGSLWRLAVEGFIRILLDDVKKLTEKAGPELTITRPARMRIWKEVADIFEIFLIGYCGRALSVTVDSADESLEMNLLDILGDKILKSQTDAPLDILERLITTLDRCASRTCSLPLETVELMPSHCSRFSLTCLQKLFLLCSFSHGTGEGTSTRCEVSNISIKLLMTRCEFILGRFLMDGSRLGENPLPAARVEEVIFVLQELALLVVHSDTVSQLNLHPYLKEGLTGENQARRSHLLVLFPSFCELVISREARVRELVQVLLRHIIVELGLQKST